MRIKRQYLISYQFQIGDSSDGFGSIHITTLSPWYKRGYEYTDIRNSRKIIVERLRKDNNIPVNKRVGVVILNIIRFPL